jgi:hypothetical protein
MIFEPWRLIGTILYFCLTRFSMKLQFLSKTVNNKRFKYSPRFYDELKERLYLKKKEFNRLANEKMSDSERKNALRNNLKSSWSRHKAYSEGKKSANIRVLILIGVLLALGYFVFNGINDVDNVVKKLW